MPSCAMLRGVVLVRNDVPEERNASIIRVRRISELGTTIAVISNGSTLRRLVNANLILMMEAIRSSETSDLKRATRNNIPADGILHRDRRKYLNLI
jgi:hypothetical protein